MDKETRAVFPFLFSAQRWQNPLSRFHSNGTELFLEFQLACGESGMFHRQ